MSCATGKQSYATEADALDWLAIKNEQMAHYDRTHKRRRKVRKRLLAAVYRCDECGQWHQTKGWRPARKAGRYSRKARAMRKGGAS